VELAQEPKHRNTVQRQLIYNAVKELNTHPTAEQVYLHVVKKHASISKATIYRNLHSMADSGELMNIGNFSGAAHYDQHCHVHHHFVCEKCRQVFDVDGDFSDVFARINSFEVTGVSFSGICQNCF